MTEHEDYNGCYCARCLKENDVTIGGIQFRDCRMILCQVCGNKRCPKATDCRLECTGSNAPGQKGSSYEAFELAEIDGEPALRIRHPITFWTTEQMNKSETLVDAIGRNETRVNLDGVPESRDAVIRKMIDDAIGVLPHEPDRLRKHFDVRHAIDKKFHPGDTVCVVGVPEARGVVESVHYGDGPDAAARVSGIPGYSAFTFCAIEHAPDDDGVTRYHTETGEVFAECGVPTDSASDVETGEVDVSERVVMLLEDFVHLVGGQRKLIDRLWASTVAVTVMALASLAVNVYLLTGGAR